MRNRADELAVLDYGGAARSVVNKEQHILTEKFIKIKIMPIDFEKHYLFTLYHLLV